MKYFHSEREGSVVQSNVIDQSQQICFSQPICIWEWKVWMSSLQERKETRPLNIFSVLEMLVPVVINRYNKIVVKYWTFQVPLLDLPAALWQPFPCLKFYMLYFDSGVRCSRDFASKSHSVLFWIYFEFLCEETLGFFQVWQRWCTVLLTISEVHSAGVKGLVSLEIPIPRQYL